MSRRNGAAVPPSPEEAARARRVAEVRRHEVGLRSLGQPNALARQFDFADDSYEWRRLFAELFGTFLLVLVAAGGPDGERQVRRHCHLARRRSSSRRG